MLPQTGSLCRRRNIEPVEAVPLRLNITPCIIHREFRRLHLADDFLPRIPDRLSAPFAPDRNENVPGRLIKVWSS